MGCKSSKPVGDEANGGDNSNRTAKEDYVITVNEKCPHIRLDHMDGLKSMHIQGKNYSYDLRYCYVSQRGYYPNGMWIDQIRLLQLFYLISLYTYH